MIPFFELRKLGNELLDLIEPRLKKIDALELQLAEMRGALDILRSKGIPGGLNIRGTYNAGVTYIYGDVVMHGGQRDTQAEIDIGETSRP
jgi:hypothetical protein